MHNVWRMVTLGVEGGGERKHVGGTKLHAEAAGLTTLNDDGNTSFYHGISTLKVVQITTKSDASMRREGTTGCDSSHLGT
jgi:hypothetical protein